MIKIAIVGAGGAGLAAARHCLQENYVIDVFEQTGHFGGTWNYTDIVGCDENGVPVHSSMYKGLRTNLPKELMAFEDFSYPGLERSYLYQQEVLDYIKAYTEHFQLEPHIKFFEQVVLVEPIDGSWLVEYQDVKTKNKDSGKYDAVIVCNGHYKDPFSPEIEGIESFSGRIKHSHHYRTPDCYKNRKVLVIGAGPSGYDISQQIFTVASKVYLSHTSKIFLSLPDGIKQKPVVTCIRDNRAFFEDGTEDEIDDILFCTGYNYSFPFLSSSCGVKVEENYVFPLYKHLISVQNPTLAFIGLPFTVCPFPLFDVQVRFFLSTLNGHFALPSKQQMLQELDEEIKRKSTIPRRKFHQLGEDQGAYFDELTKTAKIKKVPNVIQKLFVRVRSGRNLEDCFRIVDDENWVQVR